MGVNKPVQQGRTPKNSGHKKVSFSGFQDRIAAPVHGTPNMGVNLWGASPLYENGN